MVEKQNGRMYVDVRSRIDKKQSKNAKNKMQKVKLKKKPHNFLFSQFYVNSFAKCKR